MASADLAVTIGAIKMKNPVIAASGTFGFGREFGRVLDISALGAIVTKGITLEPRAGNPPPRLWETACGLLNSVGLQNPGLAAFIRDEAPRLAACGVPVIVNISGDSLAEFCELASCLEGVPGVDGLEVNVSCPNIHAGGRPFASDPEAVYRVAAAVRRVTGKTLIVKLSPNVAGIARTAQAAEMGGADAVSCVNTYLGIAIDAERRRPVFSRVFAGLSGPAIKPLALRAVWEVASAVRIPVVGIGGICSPQDAIEFLLAGARAVAIGTGNFISPMACLEVVEGIRSYLEERGIRAATDLVGRARGHAGHTAGSHSDEAYVYEPKERKAEDDFAAGKGRSHGGEQ
ncbi:MAG: dihydroorotate dehydrogenase [Bacillota bacterium]|nr:dihydroorotate dehydrogenase [Bacillota bacterium]MDI6637691.1 dihydroorotate dehydrogenase [Bacillota bacterium]